METGDHSAQHECYSYYFLFQQQLIISRGLKSSTHTDMHILQNKGAARRLSPFLPYQGSFKASTEPNERFQRSHSPQ